MTWYIESFAEETAELLEEVDLDALLAAAVARLLGECPDEITAGQARAVAPLLGLEPQVWARVIDPEFDISGLALTWFEKAVLYGVSRMTGTDPADLIGVVMELPRETARELFGRLAPGAEVPAGELFVSFQIDPDEAGRYRAAGPPYPIPRFLPGFPDAARVTPR